MIYDDGKNIIYHKDQIDVKLFTNYIGQLKNKILRQYDILKQYFGVYLNLKWMMQQSFFN